eukprot:532105-Prymnesium_polylepis.1
MASATKGTLYNSSGAEMNSHPAKREYAARVLLLGQGRCGGATIAKPSRPSVLLLRREVRRPHAHKSPTRKSPSANSRRGATLAART